MTNQYSTISFPLFGIEWNPDRFFQIGPFTIQFYGILIALGLILAVIYAWKRASEFGIRADDLTDGVLCVVPFAVICARAFYCVFQWEQFADNPITVFYIWNGGLAIYGGVIGAVVGVTVYSLIKKIKLPALLDLVAIGFLIGQCVGRWGNFFNREAFGSVTDSLLRMGLLNDLTGKVEYHHPTFFYESVWTFAGFMLLHMFSKFRKYDGQIALGYVAWYGFGRTAIEALRTDSLYWGPFRVNQLLAAVSCFAAVIVLLVQMFREHSEEKLFVNQVAALEEQALCLDEDDDEESDEDDEDDESEDVTEEELEEEADEQSEENSEEVTEEPIEE